MPFIGTGEIEWINCATNDLSMTINNALNYSSIVAIAAQGSHHDGGTDHMTFTITGGTVGEINQGMTDLPNNKFCITGVITPTSDTLSITANPQHTYRFLICYGVRK